MYDPPHPGRHIKQELDYLGLSTAQGAEALGVTRQQLHRVVSGECGISAEMAVRLETVIGSTADHWLRLQAAYDLAQVRLNKPDLAEGLSRQPAPSPT
jgi:addiction module HigA family antidote